MIYRKLGYTVRPVMSLWTGVGPLSGMDSVMVMRPRNMSDLGRSLKGAAAKDAVYLLEKRGYRVRLRGAGKVSGVSFEGDLATVTLTNE